MSAAVRLGERRILKVAARGIRASTEATGSTTNEKIPLSKRKVGEAVEDAAGGASVDRSVRRRKGI